jgi:hypothetical protein
MSQPPYGPPPQGWPAPGSGQGEPPWASPQQGPPGSFPNSQPPYPPQAGAYAPPGQPPYMPQGLATPAPQKPLHKRPWFIVVASLVALGIIGSALDGNDDDASTAASSVDTTAPSSSSIAPAPTTTQAPVPPPAAVTPPPPPTPTPEPAPTPASFTMPDVVGMDLQSAQNLIQTFGPFISRSHDLLGGRNQLVDSNWIVCDQNIPAGQQVTGDAEGLIDLGVVKREEACP